MYQVTVKRAEGIFDGSFNNAFAAHDAFYDRVKKYVSDATNAEVILTNEKKKVAHVKIKFY